MDLREYRQHPEGGQDIILNHSAHTNLDFHAVAVAPATWSPPILNFYVTYTPDSFASITTGIGAAHGYTWPASTYPSDDLDVNAGGTVPDETCNGHPYSIAIGVDSSWTYSNGVWTSDTYHYTMPVTESMKAEIRQQYPAGSAVGGSDAESHYTVYAPPITVPYSL